jgi:hypothetical protein
MRAYIFAFLALSPALAYADVVWPALYLTGGIYTWWVIAAGLLIELIAIKWLFKVNWGQSAGIDIAANAASALLGIVLIPLSGLAYEIFPGTVVNYVFSWGTFNPVAWVATVILAATINLAIEWFVMKKAFKLTLYNRARAVLFAANLATVALAIYPMSQNIKNGI